MRYSNSAVSEGTEQMSMSNAEPANRFLYWFEEDEFKAARESLEVDGYSFSATILTPCQVLRSRNKTLVYASPSVWSRICSRQGSWYRASDKKGKTMIMSDHRLASEFDRFLNAQMSTSDFMPEQLPTGEELEEVVNAEEYLTGKPEAWERAGVIDAVMFKALFSVTGFWGKGDNLKKHWIGHRANHANFIARKFTARIDEEEVPYSVTGNERICSSCAEFFNVLEPESRKMVRSCPGAITFGGTLRDVYYDIKPTREVD
jgi:hypothetical protein